MFVYKKGTNKSHKICGVHVEYKNVPDNEVDDLIKGEWFLDPRDCYKVVEVVEPVVVVETQVIQEPKTETPKTGKGKKNAKKSAH